MNCSELSNAFDILLNSYFNDNKFKVGIENISVELDEYEKSLLLTQAQNDVVLEIYKGLDNSLGFEKSEEAREYLKPLLTTVKLTDDDVEVESIGLTDTAKFYNLPEDILYITLETAVIGTAPSLKKVKVKPIEQDNIHQILNNPFKGATNKRVLRIDSVTDKIQAQLISILPITEYHITYLKTPSPIILTDIGDLSIYGESETTESILQHPIIQDLILRKAVDAALRRFGVTKN